MVSDGHVLSQRRPGRFLVAPSVICSELDDQACVYWSAARRCSVVTEEMGKSMARVVLGGVDRCWMGVNECRAIDESNGGDAVPR